MTNGLGSLRSRIGVASLLATLGCLHCGDDGVDDKPSPGDAGESAGGGGAEPSNGGAPAGMGSGGTELAPGGSGGAETLPSGGAGGASELVPEGEHYGFVIDTMMIPTNNNQARELAFDLNGDGVPDNQLGAVFGTLAVMGLETGTEELVESGVVILLVDLQTTSFSRAAAAGFNTFYGTNPVPDPCVDDGDCGRHLDGTGSFDLTDDELEGEPCIGPIEDGVFSGTGGALPVRIAYSGQPLDLTLSEAHVELTGLSEDGFTTGRIGGLLTVARIDTQLVPGMHAAVAASIAADCTGASPSPACGCVEGSTGSTNLNLYDMDDDCEVSLEEVKENTLTASLLAPDVYLDGDGTADGLSVGFGVTGKRATFELP
ncbi:MAG: hypothetical protein K0R38_2455 [Polyangiaceae bacterium]|jgi:hypothetical protein|nr:hypothetical protein [Polyangiaceae bacterium]